VVLLLQNREVRGLMDLDGYIAAVEEGYREFGLGRGTSFPRHHLWRERAEDVHRDHQDLEPASEESFILKAAWLPSLGGAGIQAYTMGLPAGLQTYMCLFDTASGGLVAIMEVLYYDWLKTGATSALATKYLASPDASVVALYGTGRHARTQLHGLCAVRPIKRVQAYSRTRGAREAFCRQMSKDLDLEVVPVDSPGLALKDADIVTTITTSTEPVFDGKLLDPGRSIHINAMGMHDPWAREVDEHVVFGSWIVVDEWKQALTEHGEILIPMKAGMMRPSRIYAELGQIVAGELPAPPDSGWNWTLFLSGGTGIEDVAVATRLYRQAVEQGVGTEIEFDQDYEFQL